jgi:hypothetical protein
MIQIQYMFKVDDETVQSLVSGAIEDGRTRKVLPRNCNVFLKRVKENEPQAGDASLRATQCVVYPPNRKQNTSYIRVHAVCRECIFYYGSNDQSAANYTITIESDAVEKCSFNVKVTRRNEHKHRTLNVSFEELVDLCAPSRKYERSPPSFSVPVFEGELPDLDLD